MVVSRASHLLLAAPSPKTSKSVGYQLLRSNAFIHPVGRGLYGYVLLFFLNNVRLLPLGVRVVDKLVRLIEGELNAIGAQKCSMPVLGPRRLWETASRWSQMEGELFHIKDRTDHEFCLQVCPLFL